MDKEMSESIRAILKEELKAELEPIKTDIKEIKGKLESVKSQLTEFERKLYKTYDIIKYK